MSQKTKKQLQQELEKLSSEKEQLLAAKKANEKAFTKEQQARLTEVTEAVVDIEEQIELVGDEKPEKPIYDVPKGTEKMVHVKIISGNRFDPKTGKEINYPIIQMFTFGEWELFKKNHKLLGYTITEVLHDPNGDAKEFVEK